MTKLANRRCVFEFGEKEFAKAKRKGLAFSVVIFDLDLFKHVNDSFGHEMGNIGKGIGHYGSTFGSDIKNAAISI